MNDQMTVDPIGESLERTIARFPNWPKISEWIGGDYNPLIWKICGIVSWPIVDGTIARASVSPLVRKE